MRLLALALILAAATSALQAQAPYHRFRARTPNRRSSQAASHRGTLRGHRPRS